jgi:hypothetical protein
VAQTVKITPATGLLEFIGDNIANKPVLQHDNLGNLTLTLQASKKFTVGGNLKVNGKVTVVQQALTDGSTITWNFNSGANATVTLGGARTLAITGMEAGDTGLILVKQDQAGGKTLALPGGSLIVGGGAYTASAAPGATDILGVYYDGAAYWWTIGYNTVTPPLTSVGITGSDFVIANSPLTSNGTIGLALATVNSNVGQFGSATAVPVITVNAKGLVTAVSATNISIPTNLDSLTDVTITSAATGQLLQFNGSQWVNWTPNFLTSYTETDTLASVTGRGATTNTAVTFNGNVTLGNAADLTFVDLAGTFPTSGKGFDWTLNNDGARIYAIQPSSDSIDLVFQLRDNATTNDRFVFWVDDYQGAAFDKYPLIIRGGTEVDLVDAGLFVRGTQVLTNGRVLQNVTGNISMFTNDSNYATQTYVNTAVSNLVDSAPGALDTLNELAAALGDDPNFATTVATSISGKVAKAGDTMTGTLTINRNVAGLIFNRDAVSDHNGIYYSTATTPKWFIGMRENLGLNNHIHYSEELGRDVLTLDVTTGNATVFGTISSSNFSGSSSGANTGDQTTITGNAGSATVLQTARTLTIGATGKTFNGSADVAWSLAEIGAYSASNPAGYITGYSETDTLDSVIGRGNSTTRTTLFYQTSGTTIESVAPGNRGLTILQDSPGRDAYIAFHIENDYAGYFGLGGVENDLVWGGWSVGAVRHLIWHSGNLTNLNQLSNGPGYITGYTETDTLNSVTTRGNSTANSVRFGDHVDINSNGSAFRFYNGVTFRGGIGLDDWAHGGSAADVTVYVEGDNTLFFSTSGTKRASVSSSAFNSLVALQQNGNQVWHAGNDGAGSGLDADLLDGYHASTGVGANTVVVREGNGYVFLNYINSNVSESENPTINSFFTSNGDGYLRKSTIAHVRNSLGNYGGWLTQAAADPLYVNVGGDSMTGPLVITGSTSGQELFAVNGVNGRLFTVTDDL